MSDTIRVRSDFDNGHEIYSVRTDSGIYDLIVSYHNLDSLIRIDNSKTIDVVNFHFDDEYHGISSFYEIDTTFELHNSDSLYSDPRYTAFVHYNFKLFREHEQDFLIMDYKFSQFGRAFDTIEFELILDDKLLIFNKTDTLVKYRSEP